MGPTCASAAGIDPNFGSGGTVVTNVGQAPARASTNDVIRDSSGRFIAIAGSNLGNEIIDFSLARFTPGGQLDTSFGDEGMVTTDFGSGQAESSIAAAIDSSGRIVVAGTLNLAEEGGGGPYLGVARYLTDGSLDTGFGGGDGLVTTQIGNPRLRTESVAIDPRDDAIVVGGIASYTDRSGDDFVVARYLSNGTPDAGFSGDGVALTNFGIDEFGFETDDELLSLTVEPDGRIVAAGSSAGFATPQSYEYTALARYLPDGTLDTSFSGDGLVTTDIGANLGSKALAVAVDGDGDILAGGYQFFSSGGEFTLLRYLPSGSLDPGFGGGDGIVTTDINHADAGQDLAIDEAGRPILVGTTLFEGAYEIAIARYTTAGAPDTGFGGGDGVVVKHLGRVCCGAFAGVSDSGRIVVGGATDDYSSLTRFTSSGAVDTSFGTNGVAEYSIPRESRDFPRAVAMDGSGRTVVAGETTAGAVEPGLFVARYLADGSLDTGFGGDGIVVVHRPDIFYGVYAMKVDDQDNILVGGYAEPVGEPGDFMLAKFTSSGVLDTGFGDEGIVTSTFGTQTRDGARAMAIDEDGAIVLAGESEASGRDIAVARYLPSGSLDPGFGGGDGLVTTDLGASEEARAVTVDGGGRVVVGGAKVSGNDAPFAILRYTSSGGLDPSFSGDGVVTGQFGVPSESRGRAVAVDGSGRIVIAGTAIGSPSTTEEIGLARYLADGTPDATFGSGGFVSTKLHNLGAGVNGATLDASGRILVIGNAGGPYTNTSFVLSRFTSSGALDEEFADHGVASAAFTGQQVAIPLGLALQSDRKIVVGGLVESNYRYDIGLARFVDPDPVLHVAVSGSGVGTVIGSGTVAGAGINCPGDCSESHAYGSEQTLNATPSPGSVFAGWSGDCSGTGDCVLTLDTGKSVTADFAHIDIPPTAVDDTAGLNEDASPTSIGVLTNDTDADGGPRSIASVTQPAHGAVLITGSGSGLTYAPAHDYCNNPPGTSKDTFTYTLNGGSTATASMTVNCVDDPPVGVNDSSTLTEDDPATAIGVLTNDTDADGGPRSIASVTQPAHGAVLITGSGSGLTYAPAHDYCNNPPGTSKDTFTYTLNGGSTATVSVRVTCVDDPPAAVGDPAALNENAGATTIDVLANDTDVDGGPRAVEKVTQPLNGTAAIANSGANVTYAPAPNFCGADSFTYTLNGGSTATVSVTVSCVNLTSPDISPPDTRIAGHPNPTLKSHGPPVRAKFVFASSEAGSTFECSLDKAAFALCTSPYQAKLKIGKHTFRVAAADPAGNRDPSPAAFAVKVTKMHHPHSR
jgi:uncharacterized delta-60 repeat protein